MPLAGFCGDAHLLKLLHSHLQPGELEMRKRVIEQFVAMKPAEFKDVVFEGSVKMG